MEGRNKNGTFAKGNPGGPGRRPKAKELSYLALVTDVVTPDQFKAALARGLEMARRGDLGWMRFLTEYILGKPTQDVSVEMYEASRIILSWDDADAGNSVAEPPLGGTEASQGK